MKNVTNDLNHSDNQKIPEKLKVRFKMLEQNQSIKRIEKKHTILIVDDEPLNRKTMAMVLEQEYQVLMAQDGVEALELIKSMPDPEQIHLILSEHKLPQMTGVEFFQKTLPILPKTIRIILTSFTDVDAVFNAIDEGAVYKFLVKPIAPFDLEVSIRRALESYDPAG